MLKPLPGFRDFYPEQQSILNHLFGIWKQTAHRFGFCEYNAPVLEPLELFTQKSGEEIVSQLFTFEDQGGRPVALRPEMTPLLGRMVGSQANSLRRPIKWFNIGEHFRYEKPQKGRTRSFYQFNADILGESGTGADAELIALCISTLTATGLSEREFCIRLSDRSLWIEYLASFGIDSAVAPKLLSIIDKRARLKPEALFAQVQPFLKDQTEAFLAQIDVLTKIRSLQDLENFFVKNSDEKLNDTLSHRLDDWRQLMGDLESMALGAFIRIDLEIVRGLAYYTGFVFEAFAIDGTGRALAGGGRYDHLLSKLGYPGLPACGFAIGDVTLTLLLAEKNRLPRYIQAADVYMIASGKEERRAALGDSALLRQAGFSVEYPLKPVGFGKQFKLAGQSNARFALIYGTDELALQKVKLRNFSSGEECLLSRDRLPEMFQSVLES